MINQDEFTAIPLRHRTNIRSIAAKLTMSKSTVHNRMRMREGFAKRHSNPTKPLLTKLNEKAKIEFCISMIDHDKSNSNGKPTFIDMYDRVHIDEKWFYITKKSQNFYLLRDEIEPVRPIKSKTFITKIMFMTTVARPRFVIETNEWFDGKIGVFNFVCKEAARHSSKNRVAGTMETKLILVINKDVIKRCLIDEVLPAIREKWPKSDPNTTVFIQQDNARPHTKIDDLEFIKATKQDGFDIRLCFQPQHQEAPNSIDQLVAAVEKSFDKYEPELLNDVFLSFLQTMVKVLKVFGKNNYKSPHMCKGKLKRIDQLPICVSFEDDILEQAIMHLQRMDMSN